MYVFPESYSIPTLLDFASNFEQICSATNSDADNDEDEMMAMQIIGVSPSSSFPHCETMELSRVVHLWQTFSVLLDDGRYDNSNAQPVLVLDGDGCHWQRGQFWSCRAFASLAHDWCHVL